MAKQSFTQTGIESHGSTVQCVPVKKSVFFNLDPRQYRNIPVPLVKASIFVGSDAKNKTNKPKTASYRVHFPRLYLCILNVISEISGTLPGRRLKGRKSGENVRAGLGFICVDNRELQQTTTATGTPPKGLMSKTVAVHVRYKSLYIPLPFSAKQQRKMTKFCVFWRTLASAANILDFLMELIAGITY